MELFEPVDTAQGQRMRHQALRYRMLYGIWERDLEERARRQFGNIRKEAIGAVDMTSTLLSGLAAMRAVLYTHPPVVRGPSEADGVVMNGILQKAGAWSLMQRVQRDTIGLREMFLHVDASVEGAVQLTPVWPHLTESEALPGAPDQPALFRWWRDDRTVDGRKEWTCDEWDLRRPEQPMFRTLFRSRDVTKDVHGKTSKELSGQAYPWRKADGKAFIPVATYHAARTGMLYDPWSEVELVEATLNIGVMLTHVQHCVLDASWVHRWAYGVQPAGADNSSGAEVSRFVADPSVVTSFVRIDPDSSDPIQIGQWTTTTDPNAILQCVMQYERMAAAKAGINPADFARMSGDPRSGYSMALSREAQREQARAMEPQFTRGDVELIELAASMVRIRAGVSVPETGWQIRYQSLPPSQEELVQRREQLTWEQERGLVSVVDAWMRLHPGSNREEAEAALIQVRVETADLEQRAQQELKRKGLQAEAKPEPASGVVITATQQIVLAVHSGQMSRESGRGMLVNLVGLSEQQAEEVLGPKQGGNSGRRDNATADPAANQHDGTHDSEEPIRRGQYQVSEPGRGDGEAAR